MADEQRLTRVLNRAGAVQHQVAEDHAGRRRAGQKESSEQLSRTVEGLHPLLRSRHIGDDESSVGGEVEAGRLDDAAVLLPDLHDLARRRLAGVHGVHGVPAAIEDEVGSVASCWKLIASS